MQHLGTGGGDFLRLGVVQAREQARVGHLARIGGEHARHVGPDLHAARAQQATEQRRRRVRAATAEHRGAAVAMPGNEALGQQQARRLRGKTRAPVVVHFAPAGDRQAPAPVALVGQFDRIQPAARIGPAEIQAPGPEIGSTQGRGQEFALRQHFGLPAERTHAGTRIRQQSTQRIEALAQHRIGIERKLLHECAMTRDQCIDARAAVRGTVGNRGQFVGYTRKRRHHDQHAAVAFLRTFACQFADGVPAMALRHRSAAELEHEPGRAGRRRWHGSEWIPV
jgi:hypothetical protein